MQYEFGYGLSYTTFSMGDVTITPSSSGTITALPDAEPISPGGNPALFETLYTISTTVQNTGSVAGAAVAQLYLGLPQAEGADPTPIKTLRGFSKHMLQPGESCSVSFELNRRDISYWDIVSQQWTIAPGTVQVMAGFSSRDIQATGSFSPLGGNANMRIMR